VTENKNHLKKKSSPSIWSKSRSGRGWRNSCFVLSVSFGWHLHLGQNWPCFSRFEWFGICFSDEENGNTVTAGFVTLIFFHVMCLCY
jgi:hypothetical protein